MRCALCNRKKNYMYNKDVVAAPCHMRIVRSSIGNGLHKHKRTNIGLRNLVLHEMSKCSGGHSYHAIEGQTSKHIGCGGFPAPRETSSPWAFGNGGAINLEVSRVARKGP